jgi:hypothetical protein
MTLFTLSVISVLILSSLKMSEWLAIASLLFVQAILHTWLVFLMMRTILHSRQPNLSIARLVGAPTAQHMYTGAFIWLVAIIATSIFPLLSNTESAKACCSACISAGKLVRADHREDSDDLVQLLMY